VCEHGCDPVAVAPHRGPNREPRSRVSSRYSCLRRPPGQHFCRRWLLASGGLLPYCCVFPRPSHARAAGSSVQHKAARKPALKPSTQQCSVATQGPSLPHFACMRKLPHFSTVTRSCAHCVRQQQSCLQGTETHAHLCAGSDGIGKLWPHARNISVCAAAAAQEVQAPEAPAQVCLPSQLALRARAVDHGVYIRRGSVCPKCNAQSWYSCILLLSKNVYCCCPKVYTAAHAVQVCWRCDCSGNRVDTTRTPIVAFKQTLVLCCAGGLRGGHRH
jgi:hypothetical protein